uniref:Uncharacterized protein n=1 Tax=Strongyloides venezuelensis TaxID=75913 RepID=A0A0K0G1Q6_STRVS
MNFFKNLGNKLPSVSKTNKKKKKLTQKEFSSITKIIDEERKRRKKRYQEAERKKIKKEKQNKMKKRMSRQKLCQKRSCCNSSVDSKENSTSVSLPPPNILLQICKEKVLETKSDGDLSSSSKTVSCTQKEKKKNLQSTEKTQLQCISSNSGKSLNIENSASEICRNSSMQINSNQKKISKKPIRELIKEKNLHLNYKIDINETKKKKKNFDSLGLCHTAPTCRTIDLQHPYYILNIKSDVLNNKLPYLHKENNNNNWNIYDSCGIPFWVPKLENEDENTDDTTSDSIPLDSTSLIDVEQGKLELPECIDDPQDLNPFQPLRVMINRNPKYFENRTICLITLRSMAALHLKEAPSKTHESVVKDVQVSSVEITDNRELVCYPKYLPKGAFKTKYTGEVWPTKTVKPDEQQNDNKNK